MKTGDRAEHGGGSRYSYQTTKQLLGTQAHQGGFPVCLSSRDHFVPLLGRCITFGNRCISASVSRQHPPVRVQRICARVCAGQRVEEQAAAHGRPGQVSVPAVRMCINPST